MAEGDQNETEEEKRLQERLDDSVFFLKYVEEVEKIHKDHNKILDFSLINRLRWYKNQHLAFIKRHPYLKLRKTKEARERVLERSSPSIRKHIEAVENRKRVIVEKKLQD